MGCQYPQRWQFQGPQGDTLPNFVPYALHLPLRLYLPCYHPLKLSCLYFLSSAELRSSFCCPQAPDNVHFWHQADKEGWLQSQGDKLKTWRRRWHVLKDVRTSVSSRIVFSLFPYKLSIHFFPILPSLSSRAQKDSPAVLPAGIHFSIHGGRCKLQLQAARHH